jgi:hypothetical protein
MGRNLPSITQVFHAEKEHMLRFRRMLPRHERSAIDELLAFAHRHIPAVAYAGHSLPAFMFLLAMLLEQRKQLRQVEGALYILKEGRSD